VQEDDRPGELEEGGWCFVCGPRNPIGLRTAWTLEEDGAARARYQPLREHQGWSGLVHGGILSALLDEAMAQRLKLEGIRAVTASISVRFRRPTPIDGPLLVEGRIVEASGRRYRMRAAIRDGSEGAADPGGSEGAAGPRLYAEADGICVEVGANA
jgi:uncharacterized protein (TIGR00369 family)